jgi:hypothetical protein
MSSPLPRRPFASRPFAIIRAYAVAILLLVSGAGLSGCPGNLDPSLLGPKVCDAPSILFASQDALQGCGNNTSCHGTAKVAGLDLVSPGVISRLLGKMPDPASSLSCPSSTMPYLVPNSDPAMGLMLDKLNTMPSCGSAMPFPSGGLASDKRMCLMEWATAVTTGAITQ